MSSSPSARSEWDEAVLRDAQWHCRRREQDLGPAGRIYAAFRTQSGRGDSFRPKKLVVVAADLEMPLDPERAEELVGARKAVTARSLGPPPRPRRRAPLALWIADAALAFLRSSISIDTPYHWTIRLSRCA
jgi:hypothetical protein